MAVEMQPVSSSNVQSVGWDKDTRTLYVTFQSGQTYAYEGVDEVAYQDLLGSNSPGKYLNQWIKPRHPARRM